MSVASAVASDPTAFYTLLATVVVGILGFAGAIYTAASALRQSTQTNRAAADKLALDRDAAHDARVEAENTRIRAENETLRTMCQSVSEQLRETQERHARLRLAVLVCGLDPDDIIAPRQKGPDDAAGTETAA